MSFTDRLYDGFTGMDEISDHSNRMFLSGMIQSYQIAKSRLEVDRKAIQGLIDEYLARENDAPEIVERPEGEKVF